MDYFTEQLEDEFRKLDWNEVYDCIEFVLSKMNSFHVPSLVADINKVLFEEGAQYKIEDMQVQQLLSSHEADEISKASSLTDHGTHINKAVIFFNQRPVPDYENSITESLKAVESCAREITKNPSGVLSQLVKDMGLHPALQQGIDKIYAWTGDDSGLRHAIKDGSTKSFESEARFTLVFCSALVNFLKEKKQ